MSKPLPPLSLYIHIPWCVKKCPYCDFNSHTTDALPEAQYIAALLEDAKRDQALAYGRPITSIFFGGGTPSLFSAQSINTLLNELQALFVFSDDIEITLEANPGATEYSNLQGLKAAGVNRLSIGVQSFNSERLQNLGRIHSPQEAIKAYEGARRAGFTNINLDLMHGLPGQTLEQAISDLTQAIDLAPEHLSWYQLTIEPNTAFYSAPPKLPVDETLEDIYEHGLAILANAGYRQYETSAFSQPNRRAKHNLNYWQFGDYLAIGAGAHGKTTHPNGTIDRYWKTRLPKDYLDQNKDYTAGKNSVELEQQLVEFLMNGLRLVEGVPTELLEHRTQISHQALIKALQPAIAKGLIEQPTSHIVTTPLGFQFLNDVLASFD